MVAEEFLLKGKVEHFVRRHKTSMCLYVQPDDLSLVLQAVLDKTPCPNDSLERLFKGCSATQVLFKEQAVRIDFETFLNTMKGRLSELENQNFHEDDVAAYRTLSFKEASLLATTH
jgi:hypothetical protein